MIGKDEFGNLRLRERRKGGERLCICRYEVIISLWCEELVTDGSCFICEENCKVISCKSWWRRRGRRTDKRRESFEECARVRTVVSFVVVVCQYVVVIRIRPVNYVNLFIYLFKGTENTFTLVQKDFYFIAVLFFCYQHFFFTHNIIT